MAHSNKINAKTIAEYLATASPEQAKGYLDALEHFYSEIHNIIYSPHPFGEKYTLRSSKHIVHKKLTDLHAEMTLITKVSDNSLFGDEQVEPNNNLKIQPPT